MAYEVGQVLFLILPKKQHVIPVRVVEQVTRKSLDGEETSYTVEVPGQKEMYDLSDLGADVFTSIKAVESQLHENARKAISGILKSAESLSSKYFGQTSSQVQPAIGDNAAGDDGDFAQVELGDGTVAKVKLPDMPTLG